MNFLQRLEKNNQFPIIFIGAGVTQRYFKNAPSWDQLLQLIWSEVTSEQSYFVRYQELSDQYEDPFTVYTTLADELERDYNRAFLQGHVTLAELTPQQAHTQQVSPFRWRIAEAFKALEPREGIKAELKAFKGMLAKARLIVTTNYDDFIEKQLNYAVSVKVGNQGLFEPSMLLNEVYKIHGSVKDPNSIMITTRDYQKMVRTSAIVNAKLLSLLTESPILFIGYSLTDQNVRSLLQDLSTNMPFSIEAAAQRIGVVTYDQGRQNIIESIAQTDNGVHYTNLLTDDYTTIYQAVAKIDQGVSPREVAKYQGMIKQIIDVKGTQGELKQVLTSMVALEQLPEALQSKNLVVALGDNRYLYKVPDYVDYIKAYFLKDHTMPREIAIKFIVNMTPQSALPIYRYIWDLVDIPEEERMKINTRLAKFNSLEKIQTKLNIPRISEDQMNCYQGKTAVQIFEMDDTIKAPVKLAYFTKHIAKFDIRELIDYILQNGDEGLINTTNARKLFMAYSLMTEPILLKLGN